MRLRNFLVVTFALALMIASCQDSNVITQPDTAGYPDLAYIDLPPGAVLTTATLYVYVKEPSSEIVRIHRITDPWAEMTVTWNNFGLAYDPAVEGSFVTDGVGYRSADITGLVYDWATDAYPNYGLLLEQGEAAFSSYASSEHALQNNRPYLEICFEVGGVPDCVIVQRDLLGTVYDAHINETSPDENYGDRDRLYTGLATGQRKMSLMIFETPQIEVYAALGDTVWIDTNCDGIQDPGEPGFPGVTVNLYMCDDTYVGTQITDGDGFYFFDNLVPGDYYVEFIEPEGYDFTLQDQGADDAVDSDVDPATGLTICTTLDDNEVDPTWDAGLCLVPQDGCTLTIGFWKTHGGFGPQADVVTQYLPIWLGTPGGTNSRFIDTGLYAHEILLRNVYGKNKNGITKLYAQLLGAKLNIAASADPFDVTAAIADADAFLAMYDYTDWNSLSKAMKNYVVGLMSTFDDYNNGIIGPGHCDD